jgi:hypothetical protein
VDFSLISTRALGGGCVVKNEPALIIYSNILVAFANVHCNGFPDSIRQFNLINDIFTEVNSFPDARSWEAISAVARNDGEIFLHFLGTDGRLNLKRYVPSQGWTVVSTTPFAWNGIPHIVQSQNSSMLIMASRSTANIAPNQIAFYKSWDGLNWSSAGQSQHTTFARPYILSSGDFFADFLHVGTDGNRSLNRNTFFF